MSTSSSCACPPVGLSNPVSVDIVVVLPAPLWPSKAKIYPEYIVIEALSTATLPLP